jgi:hypothetical protein
MRIQRKLQRIFEQNEDLAHFLNYKAQAFYTQEPRDLAYFSLFIFAFCSQSREGLPSVGRSKEI